MEKKAQAGLEYLVTYGWALIIIATVVGVLVFVTVAPTDAINFSSTNPTKLLVKGTSIGNGITTIKLQNTTGGEIKIESIAVLSGYSNCSSSNIGSVIRAGGELEIVCTIPTNSNESEINVEYTDMTGLFQNTSIISKSSVPMDEPVCGNNLCEVGENCDTCAQDCSCVLGNTCFLGECVEPSCRTDCDPPWIGVCQSGQEHTMCGCCPLEQDYCGDGVCTPEAVVVTVNVGEQIPVTVGGVNYTMKIWGIIDETVIPQVNQQVGYPLLEGETYADNSGLLVHVRTINGTTGVVYVLGENAESCPMDCI